MPTAFRSHAKVNLGLGIGAPRADGFHALATVYQTMELYDVLTVAARPAMTTAIRVTSNDQRVPTDNCNTAWKMVALTLTTLGHSAEVEIHIDHRPPVQVGLGAGSANAVAALVGLEVELGIVQSSRAPSFERTLLEGWETTNPHPGSEGTALTPGAPGLDFETWDTTTLNQPDTPGAPSFSRSLRKGWETANLHPGSEGTALGPAHRLELAAQVG